MQENDTIAAISTPLGEGGIGIVRMSGTKAFDIGRAIFIPSVKMTRGYPEARHLYHGHVLNKEGEIVDEVLISFMPAPHTYTREDVVEINCHSGVFALRTILKITMESGARLAEPGEFTKRAFVNGRIDLSRAEAVINMIKARSEEAVKAAASNIRGDLAEKIKELRDKMIEARAPLEASFDYPEEYEMDDGDLKKIETIIKYIKEEINSMLKDVDRNRAFQEGVSIAIIGKPNVGKSSLLNAMLKQQRAIVHEIPGTTRDLLEGYMNLGGYPIKLIDTAGIQGTDDPVEKEGIARSRKAAEQAKMIITVHDGSRKWEDEDGEIAAMVKPGQGKVIVINKKDLGMKISLEKVKRCYKDAPIVQTAAIRGEGMSDLEEAAAEQMDLFFKGISEGPAVISLRHEQIMKETLLCIEEAQKMLIKEPPELISLELQNAWLKMGEITGETIQEELLDKIFSEFCLGK
ncbi:MAG: tRNA uridine-5-carboxymethylaminomethyl(34) synthesis GTPase MnmE [Bacillota bacterium]|nr:tRNA uridine-5-carboxymethylaminomethyl(34) synthesis GTPase MnmE [Bacillota bacterium]